jgi:hypothetical protein
MCKLGALPLLASLAKPAGAPILPSLSYPSLYFSFISAPHFRDLRPKECGNEQL